MLPPNSQRRSPSPLLVPANLGPDPVRAPEDLNINPQQDMAMEHEMWMASNRPVTSADWADQLNLPVHTPASQRDDDIALGLEVCPGILPRDIDIALQGPSDIAPQGSFDTLLSQPADPSPSEKCNDLGLPRAVPGLAMSEVSAGSFYPLSMDALPNEAGGLSLLPAGSNSAAGSLYPFGMDALRKESGGLLSLSVATNTSAGSFYPFGMEVLPDVPSGFESVDELTRHIPLGPWQP